MYDSMITITYSLGSVNFVNGGTAKLPVPRGATFARVLDLMVVATVTFTQTTTPALLQIGDGTTANKFAELNLGATAAGSSISGRDPAAGVWKANYLSADYATVLHDLIATFVAPTGGTPAGTGNVYVIVGYDQILK